MGFSFYDIELLVKIGEYDIGTKFNTAPINFETSELELYNTDDGKPVKTFKLELKVI